MNTFTYMKVKDKIPDVLAAARNLDSQLLNPEKSPPRDVLEDRLDDAIVNYMHARKQRY